MQGLHDKMFSQQAWSITFTELLIFNFLMFKSTINYDILWSENNILFVFFLTLQR